MGALLAGHEVDFVWPAERLIVETDGWQTDGTRSAFEADRSRDAGLVARGYAVMRFTWRQVLHDRAGVADRLAAALAQRQVPKSVLAQPS